MNEFQQPAGGSKTPASIPAPKNAAPLWEKKDALLAASSIITGYFYVRWVLFSGMSFGVTVFTLLFALTAAFYLEKADWKAARAYTLVLLFSGLQFLFGGAEEARFLNLVFLHGIAVYWFITLAGMRCTASLRPRSAADLLSGAVLTPASNFLNLLKPLLWFAGKKHDSKQIFALCLGAAIALPLTLWAVFQLMAADIAFKSFIGQFSSLFTDSFYQNLLFILLAIPVAHYLFGMFYGLAQKNNASFYTSDELDYARDCLRMLEPLTIYVVLALLCSVYAVFFLSQSAYLFSAFSGFLPGGFTLAEYARQGFFELCRISAVNLAVISVSQLMCKQQPPSRAMRLFYGVLSVETLLLIAASASKMLLYVSAFALTPKRLYTLWFLAGLAVIFSLLLYAQIKPAPVFRYSCLSAVVLFLLFCYSDPSRMIASYNIKAAEGAGATLDMALIHQCRASAVPIAVKTALETDDNVLRGQLEQYITHYIDEHMDLLKGGSIGSFNLTNWDAKRSIAQFKAAQTGK